jgi:hypothetical protein
MKKAKTKKRDQFHLRLTVEQKREIVKQAKKKGLRVNAYILKRCGV